MMMSITNLKSERFKNFHASGVIGRRTSPYDTTPFIQNEFFTPVPLLIL